jgi:hypothetical protein
MMMNDDIALLTITIVVIVPLIPAMLAGWQGSA